MALADCPETTTHFFVNGFVIATASEILTRRKRSLPRYTNRNSRLYFRAAAQIASRTSASAKTINSIVPMPPARSASACRSLSVNPRCRKPGWEFAPRLHPFDGWNRYGLRSGSRIAPNVGLSLLALSKGRLPTLHGQILGSCDLVLRHLHRQTIAHLDHHIGHR